MVQQWKRMWRSREISGLYEIVAEVCLKKLGDSSEVEMKELRFRIRFKNVKNTNEK